MQVAILRIGDVDMDVVQHIQKGLSEIFPETHCTILEDVMRVPMEAYNAGRRQHHSTHILSKINEYLKRINVYPDRVLGVVNIDLYVPNLNFVFGEAEFLGKTALISLFRLHPQFYGQSINKELLFERSLKEAVHEIGHTLGLRHCYNTTCVMFFSNSILDTDRKFSVFCEKCYAFLVKYV